MVAASYVLEFGFPSHFAAELLAELLSTSSPQLEDVGASGAAGWEALSKEDFKLLLEGMLRAWQAARRKQLYCDLDAHALHAVDKRVRCLPDTAVGTVRPPGAGISPPAPLQRVSVPVSTALAFRLYREQLLECLDGAHGLPRSDL